MTVYELACYCIYHIYHTVSCPYRFGDRQTKVDSERETKKGEAHERREREKKWEGREGQTKTGEVYKRRQREK